MCHKKRDISSYLSWFEAKYFEIKVETVIYFFLFRGTDVIMQDVRKCSLFIYLKCTRCTEMYFI